MDLAHDLAEHPTKAEGVAHGKGRDGALRVGAPPADAEKVDGHDGRAQVHAYALDVDEDLWRIWTLGKLN